jgi:biotin transport system substrate-specific component
MTVLVEAGRPAGVLGDVIASTRVRGAALVGAAVAWIAVASQVIVPLGFTPVPLSLGTFAVLTTGAVLGVRRAAIATSLYLLVGLAGVGVFAGGGSGTGAASLGYVFGYIAAAVLAGWAAERGADRRAWSMGLSMLGSTTVIYVFGVSYMVATGAVPAGEALALGVLPFLPGDAIKAVAATAVFPSIWSLLGRRR